MKFHARSVAALAALLAAGAALAGTWSKSDGQSEFYKTIHSDPTWLSYLPSADASTDIVLIGLNSEDATGQQMRRVDFMDQKRKQVVSLCFAESKEAVLTACPGSTFLGVASRDGMELNAVSQVGRTAVAWLDALDEPTPDTLLAD